MRNVMYGNLSYYLKINLVEQMQAKIKNLTFNNFSKPCCQDKNIKKSVSLNYYSFKQKHIAKMFQRNIYLHFVKFTKNYKYLLFSFCIKIEFNTVLFFRSKACNYVIKNELVD